MTSEQQSSPVFTSGSSGGWTWRMMDSSRPRRAVEHISHSEVTPVGVGRLRSEDVPADLPWVLERDIPVIVVDTLDSYWVFERVLNKLHSFGKTAELAKADLVGKLGGHLKLLASLESPAMAPMLRLELEYLRASLRPL